MGRWHVVDPMAEKYYSFSTYCYAGNNPIKYIDVDGFYFTDSTNINNVENHANKIINSENKRQGRLQNKINNRSAKGKRTAGIERRKGKSEKREAAMNHLIGAIDQMRRDPNVGFQVNWGWNSAGSQQSGYTEATSNTHVVFHISSEYGLNGLAHELIHGKQFLDGNIDFTSSGSGGLIYDLWDESEAYTVESAYRGFSNFKSYNPNMVLNKYESSYPKYKELSTMPLNTNTPMGVIRLNNAKRIGSFPNINNYSDKTLYKNKNLGTYFR